MLSRVSAMPVRLPESVCISRARRQYHSAASGWPRCARIQPTAFSEYAITALSANERRSRSASTA